MLGADVDLLRWLHKRLASGDFSLDNRDDYTAVNWLGQIVIRLEAEQSKVPGPNSIPHHPFRKDWA